MTEAADFHASYAAALRDYVATQSEDTLAVGHELGRRALQDQISMLEIIENHSRLVDGPADGDLEVRRLHQREGAHHLAPHAVDCGRRERPLMRRQPLTHDLGLAAMT